MVKKVPGADRLARGARHRDITTTLSRLIPHAAPR
jgi:hypothetical protein